MARNPVTFDTAAYWQDRYARGGTSGEGSRGAEARYKAALVDDVVRREGVMSILDLGCGDGHVAGLLTARCPYLGYDPAPAAIARCRADTVRGVRTFTATLPSGRFDLVLSLDVIFHLIGEAEYRAYLATLFGRAERFVLVYGTDEPAAGAPHWHGRRWTPDIPAGWFPEALPGPFKMAWLLRL